MDHRIVTADVIIASMACRVAVVGAAATAVPRRIAVTGVTATGGTTTRVLEFQHTFPLLIVYQQVPRTLFE